MTRAIFGLTVLVTGAGRGLGATIARAFVCKGARVAIIYRTSRAWAAAWATELGQNAAAFQVDVSGPVQAARKVAQTRDTPQQQRRHWSRHHNGQVASEGAVRLVI